jgi:hypothetical protein
MGLVFRAERIKQKINTAVNRSSPVQLASGLNWLSLMKGAPGNHTAVVFT